MDVLEAKESHPTATVTHLLLTSLSDAAGVARNDNKDYPQSQGECA